MSVQCRGITNKDERCKKKVSDDDYCHHHKDQKRNPIQPGLPKKVQTLIKKGPSKSDSEGHIYVYYLKEDQSEVKSYWKIGRTTQSVKKRLSQWEGAILQESFKVNYNKMAERMIHLLLDKSRIYRYKHKGGHHSVYKKDGSTLYDSQTDTSLKLEARKKHVEWFVGDWSSIRRTILGVVNYVNKI